MKAVYGYGFQFPRHQHPLVLVGMPEDAQPLSVLMHHGRSAVIYAEISVDLVNGGPEGRMLERRFTVVRTGIHAGNNPGRFLGSINFGAGAWHVYDQERWERT